jgi:hypothetical protein
MKSEIIKKHPNLPGQHKFWLAPAIASVFFVARSYAAVGGDYQNEAMDIGRAKFGGCEKCYFMRAIGKTWPLPNRFVAVTRLTSAAGCMSWSSPAGVFLGEIVNPENLVHWDGLIRSCLTSMLDMEANKLGKNFSPRKIFKWQQYQVKEWTLNMPSGLRYIAFIRGEAESLWIQDANPLLWDAMKQFVESRNSMR